jgi:peroxidase
LNLQGCDASLLLTGANSEQQLPPNLTLQPRALQLIEDIRAQVHAACGPTVSCADITALATRDAIVAVRTDRYMFAHCAYIYTASTY